jgi:hypothetical protein
MPAQKIPEPADEIEDENHDPYALIREDVRDEIEKCDRFSESLKAELAALKPLPQRPRSPEPPPEPELSPDARAARTMLALGNLRIGRPANAFYAEAFEYRERLVQHATALLAEARALGHTGAAAPPVTALDRAKAAIETAPERSNRSIAEEIGVDEGTVRKARKISAVDSAVETRLGLDGRRRRLPGERPIGPSVQIVEGKILVDPAFFEQPWQDETPELDWQTSVAHYAGIAISLPAHWARGFKQYKEFAATAVMIALAERAAETWTEIARDLKRRRK